MDNETYSFRQIPSHMDTATGIPKHFTTDSTNYASAVANIIGNAELRATSA